LAAWPEKHGRRSEIHTFERMQALVSQEARLPPTNQANIGYDSPYNGHVWFSFFLTSFSENLAMGRIWLWEKSEYHYDYVWRKINLFIGLRN
jgi:hypothetical protein